MRVEQVCPVADASKRQFTHVHLWCQQASNADTRDWVPALPATFPFLAVVADRDVPAKASDVASGLTGQLGLLNSNGVTRLAGACRATPRVGQSEQVSP